MIAAPPRGKSRRQPSRDFAARSGDLSGPGSPADEAGALHGGPVRAKHDLGIATEQQQQQQLQQPQSGNLDASSPVDEEEVVGRDPSRSIAFVKQLHDSQRDLHLHGRAVGSGGSVQGHHRRVRSALVNMSGPGAPPKSADLSLTREDDDGDDMGGLEVTVDPGPVTSKAAAVAGESPSNGRKRLVVQLPVPLARASRGGSEPGSPLTPTQQPRPPTLPAHQRLVDALKAMHIGTSFLRVASRGPPHFRQFRLLPNNRTIQWYSPNKMLGESQIHLADINSVLMGQMTANFRRIEDDRLRELQYASFSVTYGKGQTLDVVAKDMEDLQLWTEGLNMLLKEHREGHDVSKLRALIVKVEYGEGSRDDLQLDVPARHHAHRRVKSREVEPVDGDKERGRFLDAKGRVIKALKIYERDERDMMSTPFAEDLRTKVSDIQRHLDACEKSFKDASYHGDYSSASQDLWNLELDLDSFDAIYKTAKKSEKMAHSNELSVSGASAPASVSV